MISKTICWSFTTLFVDAIQLVFSSMKVSAGPTKSRQYGIPSLHVFTLLAGFQPLVFRTLINLSDPPPFSLKY
ncbi:hypothetical protein SLEP1_g1738 [Rubroshorea leprosula]|uniref:Uncharacterized protein n=1 Tax=Rubroshorea leprosula TaxID=152421 RepID=A0AAV5HEQ4_9ROSI|nr:hypothetical protein SLEP1_g1738 [Rubroshorea leprosula]